MFSLLRPSQKTKHNVHTREGTLTYIVVIVTITASRAIGQDPSAQLRKTNQTKQTIKKEKG